MNRVSFRVATLVVCAALLATIPALGAECDDPLDIGRGEVPFHVPSSYDASVPTPLVIFLHPYPYADTLGEAYLRLTPLSDLHGFLYAIPEGTADSRTGDPFWNATDSCCDLRGSNPDDSGYLRLLIDTLKSRCNVDPRRVYLVGYSNGGFMAYRMACDHAESISAIASLSGATFYRQEDCRPQAPVHVLEIHGTRDQLVFYDGGYRLAHYPGAVQTLETWARYNRCLEPPEEILHVLDLDSSLPGEETSITRYAEGCRPGSSAELWTIEGGKHSPELSEQFSGLVVEHLLSRLGCSGKEGMKKTKCSAKGKLKVKLRNGMGHDSYILGLSDDTVVEGQLNRKGRANIKISNMPLGEGTAVVLWGCGATADSSYSCP